MIAEFVQQGAYRSLPLRLIRVRRAVFGVLLALLLAMPPAAVQANPGDLDPTFGTGGMVTTPIGSSEDLVKALVLQPDGKLVAAGPTYNLGKFNLAVARYNTDGSLDGTFGTGGKITTLIGNNNYNTGTSLVLQADGKLVAVGSAFGALFSYEFALVRYNADGSLDPTFGMGGKVTTPIGGSMAFALVLQPDGKLVAAGGSDTFCSGPGSLDSFPS
jgi:uncharacterized delta-60 repeat protein